MKYKSRFIILPIFFIFVFIVVSCGRNLNLSPQKVTLPPRLYVVNSGSKSLSIIDTETNTVESSLSLGGTPWDIALSLDGKRAYITLPGMWMVEEVNIVSNMGIKYFDAGVGAAGIVLSPNGKLAYTADYHSSSISIIDLEADKTSSIEAVYTPIYIVRNNDGTRLFVTNVTQNSVSIIDTEAKREIATISCGASPYGIEFCPTNDKIYVVNFASNGITIINASTNTIETTVALSSGSKPNDIAISPDGKYAYVANNGSNSVSVIDLTNNNEIKSITVGTKPFAIICSPDGNKVYVTNDGSNTVSIINTETLTMEASIDVGTAPRGLAYRARTEN